MKHLFNDFCGFWSVAVNTMDKLQFLIFVGNSDRWVCPASKSAIRRWGIWPPATPTTHAVSKVYAGRRRRSTSNVVRSWVGCGTARPTRTADWRSPPRPPISTPPPTTTRSWPTASRACATHSAGLEPPRRSSAARILFLKIFAQC